MLPRRARALGSTRSAAVALPELRHRRHRPSSCRGARETDVGAPGDVRIRCGRIATKRHCDVAWALASSQVPETKSVVWRNTDSDAGTARPVLRRRGHEDCVSRSRWLCPVPPTTTAPTVPATAAAAPRCSEPWRRAADSAGVAPSAAGSSVGRFRSRGFVPAVRMLRRVRSVQ